MSATVIINEQHRLLPDQEQVLEREVGQFDFSLVSKDGWSREEMDIRIKELRGEVIFVSPIPYMIVNLAYMAGLNDCASDCEKEYPYAKRGSKYKLRVRVFCNDTREKKELPNGEIISVPTKTGWYLA